MKSIYTNVLYSPLCLKNPEFVKFDKVDKSYDGKVLVVKDLQLDIAEGEFITMLGPSGSGKTTCLMMLAGFETPTNGEILLRWKYKFLIFLLIKEGSEWFFKIMHCFHT